MSWIAASLLLAVFIRKQKVKRIAWVSAIILFFFFSSPITINIALQQWEYEPKSIDEIPLVRTGVMLGGALGTNKLPEGQLHLNNSADRLTESIHLLEIGIIQKLIISGGSGSLLNQDEKESANLIQRLSEWSVPGEVIEESNSRNTHENAVETAKVLESNNTKDQPILLITSAFHMRRAVKCYEKQGMKVIPYPVDFEAEKFRFDPSFLLPSANALENWAKLLKEWIGFLAYRVFGYA